MARSDVEALSRSFRSRIGLLALIVVAGLGLALWTSTREAGIGEPEDRRRILVVTGVGSEVDYHAVLEEAGFVIEVDDLDDWLAAAHAALSDSDAQGVARVLELADQRGFALVVFELDLHEAGRLDFGDLAIEPPISSIDQLDERDYLALSVGDYAFPHRSTVNQPGPAYLRLPGYGALDAVFRQPLISLREAPDRPTVAELQFEDAIRVGREMFERPAGFAAAIAGAAASVATTLDDGSGARMLLPPLSTGTAIPTPDGGILLFHHELVIYSDDARTLELEAPAQMQISWIDPSALAIGFEAGELELEPCRSLAGGVLVMAERPRIEAALDGSAVAIGSPEGAIVWRKTDAPGCVWAPIAELDHLDGIVLAPSLPGAELEAPSRSVAARIEHDEAGSRVLGWALVDDNEAGDRLEPQIVIEQHARRLAGLAFLDDQHLATSSTSLDEAAEQRVELLDRTQPGVSSTLPVELFAPGRRLRELFALAPASEVAGPELLVTVHDSGGRIELIRVRLVAEAWRVPELTAEELEVAVVFDAASVLGIGVGSDAVVVSSADGPLPAELTWIDLSSGDRRALTENRVRDYLPRMADDGSHATFVSLVRVNLSATAFSVPRVVVLHSDQ